MSSLNDSAWQSYLDQKKIVLDGSSFYEVDAEELKELAGREPRLLAKFDEPGQLPEPLAKAGYTLLPDRNGRYILFPGNLFVSIPSCLQQQAYNGQPPFRLETAGRGCGESQYIDKAYIIGLLSDFVGIDRSKLFLTIRGRERTGVFSFSFSRVNFNVQGVQIEVDAGYEGPRDIVLIEAKVGKRDYFNLRQLYYPFRHFKQLVPGKHVRSILLIYDITENQYHLYELGFYEENDPGSWHFLLSRTYQLTTSPVSHIDELINVNYETHTNIAPQANDLNRIVELLDFINNGIQTSQEVADAFVFDLRQSSYYREAAEYLGLVYKQQNRFQLTSRGEKVVLADLEEKRRLLALCIVNSWIFVRLIDLACQHRRAFSIEDIEEVIASVPRAGEQRYNKTTIPRRRQTVVAWILWLSNQFGCFEKHGSNFVLK